MNKPTRPNTSPEDTCYGCIFIVIDEYEANNDGDCACYTVNKHCEFSCSMGGDCDDIDIDEQTGTLPTKRLC
jgi:hypothetical protein